MKIVDTICTHDNVEIITIDKLPNKADTLANVFDIISLHNINVDMISYLNSCKNEICVSFSSDESCMNNLMRALASIKSLYKTSVTHIGGANTKLVLRGNMKSETGVASMVFSILCKKGIEIRLVSTSLNEISLVVGESDADAAYEVLLKEFGGQ